MDHETFGRHVLAEIRQAPFDKLNDAEGVLYALVQGARMAGATVLEEFMHRFEPQGLSAVVVLAESHVTIHTFPEHGYASFDAYTCGEKANPLDILMHAAEFLEGTATVKFVPRGLQAHIPAAFQEVHKKEWGA